MKNTLLNFKTIDLHDAVIQDIHISDLDNGVVKVSLKCKVYLSNDDRNRKSIEIDFEKVKKNTIIFNTSELFKNANAGNISSSYIYKNTYQFSLFGGYIEIKSNIPPKVTLG